MRMKMSTRTCSGESVLEQTFVGARPVYRGVIGIDATWKSGYPKPLETDDAIVRKVDRRWAEYWK